ncbi:hypothetical protein OS125_11270 [Corynebacterium sp. P7003]|uniref:Uncharacterized protein n=1 Tax=Corynebacterium pygosceleis TaxID=2800406 RepID=A0ABT3WUB2_9CORY|nr:hypothetical protein [Corynebacterium pygosceleis]MCX7445812.1 hypothetical protein [Corynebacterium pygosceleis]
METPDWAQCTDDELERAGFEIAVEQAARHARRRAAAEEPPPDYTE